MAESAGSGRPHTVDIEIGLPASQQRRPLMSASDLRLLGDFEGVINPDAKVSHGRLKLGVT